MKMLPARRLVKRRVQFVVVPGMSVTSRGGASVTVRRDSIDVGKLNYNRVGFDTASSRSNFSCSHQVRTSRLQIGSRPRNVPVLLANLSTSIPRCWSIDTNKFGKG
jgi:hypothetical protein